MRVLVVEDQYVIAEDIGQNLAAVGCQIVGLAPSVPDAIQLIDDNPGLNLAVLDVNLAGEPVFDLVDLLGSRQVRCVFATGCDKAAIPSRYAHIPRVDKPIELHRLTAALERA
ncbi:MAG: response regulator [Brevundimonas sp.]|uniref:response regulator n=1 Tax=Brevundimonas sp. TaxID=1871086 RepID=UPI0039188BFF